MQTHHEIEFAQFMESVFLNGAASMRWDRVCLWFGIDQMGDETWRLFHAKWIDICTRYGYADDIAPLFSYGNPNALVVVREAFADEEVLEISDEGASPIEEDDEENGDEAL